ncbi:MAG: DEAD/DEAH box helicase [Pseudobacter sp.]|uniref:DEAD/DEAH box helicase n=1 Tax=Pseudobacter sp. TaxID=2045420 RepID=UPI003F7D6D93
MKKALDILGRLLRFELRIQAIRLQFIEGDPHEKIDREFLMEILIELNALAVRRDEEAKKLLIGITALLWNYRDINWDGLRDHLLLYLSQAGFGPSSIMLDKEYSHTDKTYSFSTSVLNQYAVGVAQARNEVFVGERRYLLTEFQKELWESLDRPLVGISAPTSAGKSFLILLKTIDLLVRKPGTVVYVVPTLSLVSQVMADYRAILNQFGMEDYSLESAFNLSTYNKKTIYVLTQERAIAAFSQGDTPFEDVRLLVVDEIQNVERVANHEEQRAKVLFDLMVEFRNSTAIDHVIISGPRIVKIDELGESIFGQEAIKKETSSSPVLNLTYSIHLRKKNQYYLRVFSDLLPNPMEIKITEDEAIKGYGKAQYGEEYLGYLQQFASSFDDECVLIFSPNPDVCSRMANYFSRVTVEEHNPFLDSLSAFIADTVHRDYPLVPAIKRGIAFHHGKLPSHVRPLIEYAIKRNWIKKLIATTTLLQGVNLPVQNIIIRNPNLFVQRKPGSVSLSNYELANLRGRAGRLLKDFVGRTFMLDEDSFCPDGSEQLDLFKGTEKELSVGYGGKYQEFKREIKQDIKDQIGSTESNKEYSYVTTHIRQVVMKHGVNAQTSLSRVGINLTDRELNEVIEKLREVTVDHRVCSRNRYWDPLDLQRLQQQSQRFLLPTGAANYGNAQLLKEALQQLDELFPTYYEKHFGIRNTGTKDVLLQVCILADKWAREIPLATILSSTHYKSSEQIEKAVEYLEGKISYGLAQLLKPLYDIRLPESIYPRCLELGAYRPLTRGLIELNIPRETAVFLQSRIRVSDVTSKAELIEAVRGIRPTLNEWYQRLLENV